MVIENKTGSKKVNIKKDGCGQFGAFYVQSDGMGGEQVLATKWYATEKAAIKWAKKQLS